MSGSDKSVRRVMFHADDFGMNAVVNAGILDSFRKGVLTSTSLLANASAATEACEQWRTLLKDQSASNLESSAVRRELNDPCLPFDLGVHLNLTQGKPLTSSRYPIELLNECGDFPGIGKLFIRIHRATRVQIERVADELRAQIEWMCDHALKPSHLNGHQYVELLAPIADMLPDLLQKYEIPVCRVARESGLFQNVLAKGRPVDWGVGVVKRHYASRLLRRLRQTPIRFPVEFFGTSHAGKIDQPTMSKFLERASMVASTEVGIHPGAEPSDDLHRIHDPWFDPLQRDRVAERDLLCSSELRDLMRHRGLALGRLQLLAPTQRPSALSGSYID